MPDELLEVLQMPDVQFHHVAEDIALGRIYRGYENTSDEIWVSGFFLLNGIADKLCMSEGIAQAARWDVRNIPCNDS